MKSAKTSAISGCVVWILSIGIIATCVLPIFVTIGSVSSFSEFAINVTGNIVCPTGTTPERHTYATTTTDEFGNSHPATGYELHCVDETGTIVKNDTVVFGFLWVGLFALIGILISGVVAFAFAAPIGILIGRLFKRPQQSTIAANIEPT